MNYKISVSNHPKSDQGLVDLCVSAITNRTRLLMICHTTNITGHTLPVRKICAMAHSCGVEVMVDSAHAYAHIDFDIKELDALVSAIKKIADDA